MTTLEGKRKRNKSRKKENAANSRLPLIFATYPLLQSRAMPMVSPEAKGNRQGDGNKMNVDSHFVTQYPSIHPPFLLSLRY